jgi:hypothetical protein
MPIEMDRISSETTTPLMRNCFDILKERLLVKWNKFGSVFYWIKDDGDLQRIKTTGKHNEFHSIFDELLSQATGQNCEGCFQMFWNCWSTVSNASDYDYGQVKTFCENWNKKNYTCPREMRDMYRTSESERKAYCFGLYLWSKQRFNVNLKRLENFTIPQQWIDTIKFGWFGGDQEKTNQMLDWFASIVQRPCYKTKLMIVLRPNPSTFCQEILRPILDILGDYGKTINTKSDLDPYDSYLKPKDVKVASLLFVTPKLKKPDNLRSLFIVGKEFRRQSIYGQLDNFTNVFFYSKSYQIPTYTSNGNKIHIYTREIIPPQTNGVDLELTKDQLNQVDYRDVYNFLLRRETVIKNL